jgi:hypothetical protein
VGGKAVEEKPNAVGNARVCIMPADSAADNDDDIGVQTDRDVPVNRPDIIIKNKT